ncbi:MAG: class I SAM-dependent methyltransferase [Egibacteraceae bacterium]
MIAGRCAGGGARCPPSAPPCGRRIDRPLAAGVCCGAQTVLSALRDHILPLAPGLIDRLERGIRVLDVGCGRGRALLQLAEWFPNSTFVGYDLSEEAIAHARSSAGARDLTHVTFQVQDAAHLIAVEQAGTVGLVTTFDAVHDQADPEGVVRAIHHVLVDDGIYLAQDIDGTSSHHGDLDHPIGPLLYTISCRNCSGGWAVGKLGRLTRFPRFWRRRC